jgi:hypothetical protein
MDSFKDIGWWQQLFQLSPHDQSALVLALIAGVLFPPGIEHSIPAPKRPSWLWWASLAIACVLCMVISACFADTARHGLGLGLFAGAVCHFFRWGLSFVPGLKWMMAKAQVQDVYDDQGKLRGYHVEGIDQTLVPGRPGDKTQPGAGGSSMTP